MTYRLKRILVAAIAVLQLVLGANAVFAQSTGTDSVDPGTVDTSGIDNIVTVTGNYGATEVENDAFEEVPVETADPDIAVVKTATIGGSPVPATGAEVGDIITYTYTVQNTGNVVLTDVELEDNHNSAAGVTQLVVDSCSVTTDATVTSGADTLNENDTTIVVNAGANDTLSTFGPDDVVTCTSTYTVTQADVDQLQ